MRGIIDLRERLIAAVVLTLFASTSMSAEEQGKDERQYVEQIVVTATKRSESILDVPLSLQAFDGDMLERAGIHDTKELINLIPGATVVSDPGPAVTVFHMRASGVSGVTGDSPVGYYIDDVAFSIPNAPLAPPTRIYDLERIEVLRGPQGTLWGLGSMGGTVRFLTKDPDLSSFGLKGEVMSRQVEDGDSGYTVNAAVNLPVIEDKFAIRLIAGKDDIPGWAESPDFPEEEDVNDVQFENYRLKALFQPNEDLSMAFTYWHMKSEQNFDTAMGGDPEDNMLAPSLGAVRPYTDSESDFASLSIEYELSFATLESSTGYLQHYVEWLQDLSGLQYTNTYDVDSHFNQELRLVSTGDSRLKWLAGVFFSDTDYTKGTKVDPISDSDAYIDVTDIAVFGEISYDMFNGKLVPLLGLRYYRDDRSVREVFVTGTTPGQSNHSNVYNHVSPKLNVSYFATERSMYYLNIAEGFRSGVIQGDAAVANLTNAGVEGAEAILPENTVWSYEIGGKWTLFDDTLSAEAAVYYTDYESVHTLGLFGSPPVFGHAEAGDGRAVGIEMALFYQTPIPGLRANFSGSTLLENEWYDTPPTSVLFEDGDRLSYTPEYNYSVGLNYLRPLPFAGTSLAVDMSYAERGDQITISGRESAVINDFSATVGIETESWSVYLYGKNLTDERGPTLLILPNRQHSYYPKSWGVTLAVNL